MGRGEQICRSATDKCCSVLHQLKKAYRKEILVSVGFPLEGMPQLQMTILDCACSALNLLTRLALLSCSFLLQVLPVGHGPVP